MYADVVQIRRSVCIVGEACESASFCYQVCDDEPINWQALFDFLPVTTTDGKQATGDEMVLLPWSRVLCQHQVLPSFAPCHRPSFPGPEADLAMACCGWFRLKGSETIEIQILPAWLAIEATYKTRLYHRIL